MNAEPGGVSELIHRDLDSGDGLHFGLG